MSFPEVDVQAPEFDAEMFDRVVLYICSAVDNIRDLSLTKLHKILYYADREVYLETDEPLTGETYVKHEYGPFSKHLDETLDRLEDEGRLEHVEKRGRSDTFGQYTQKCFVAKEPADVDFFTPRQIQLLDSVVREISKEHDSESISEVSHDIVWRSAQKGEPIPYYTSLLQVTESATEPEEKEWARRMAAKVTS